MAEKTKILIEKDSEYVLPGLIFNTSELTELRDFYQFVLPSSSMTPLSFGIDEKLTTTEKDILWNEMILLAGAVEEDFIFSLFLNNKLQDIAALKLDDNSFVADKVKGFAQCKSPNSKGADEHKVDCLFKRIRDALAHGRVAVSGEFIIFEDKTNQMTGRIVLTLKILKNWKEFITRTTLNNIAN